MERPVSPSDDAPEHRSAPAPNQSRPGDTPGWHSGSEPDEVRLRGFGTASSSIGAAGPAKASASAAERAVPAREPRIEAYLAEVFAPLAGMVTPARRHELRAELAAHLEALIAAHLELGSAPADAVEAALAQLGDARRLGRVWARECRRPASARPWPAPVAVASTLFAGLSLLAGGALGTSLLIGLEQHLGHNLFELALGGPLFPLAAGVLVGLWRGRHPLGSRWGLLLIALAGAGVSLVMTLADPRPALVLLIRTLLWLMTTCAAAGLGALTSSSREFLTPRVARS